ncbi:MAG: hypothetical protein EBV65_11215, partial [Gammaproteobacteria bacterium]|nr:hypothetical protein [Gammaproteobacteria bacterium]
MKTRTGRGRLESNARARIEGRIGERRGERGAVDVLEVLSGERRHLARDAAYRHRIAPIGGDGELEEFVVEHEIVAH